MGVDDWGVVAIGVRMQNDTSTETKGDSQSDDVEDDSGKSMEEINEEIEQALNDAPEVMSDTEAEEVEVLDPEAQMEADVLKWKETAMRTAADLENFRKRVAREKTEAIKYGNQSLIEDLLPVIDNFSMGMMAAEADSGSMIFMGMKMVQSQIEGFLANQGVTEANTVIGSEFDPNIHDAMSQEESSEYEDGKIIRVMRKGYLLGDRLIRPANVVVSKTVEVAEETAENEEV